MSLPVNQILIGDALDHLRRLPDSSVDTVVTSPPYFGLRDYRTPGQLGLEPDIHVWVDHLLSVTDQLARVLTPTGSLWLNLGDSYSRRLTQGVPPKGLLLGPERLLLALSQRGWIVRNKVVWAKPNPMPASVSDRLTASWEPLYLLVRQRHYFFDLDAIREPHTTTRSKRSSRPDGQRSDRPAWAGPLAGDQSGLDRLHHAGRVGHPLGRNPRDVWTIAPSNQGRGHHATFPPRLVERPILATCPERVCATCTRPWQRGRPPPRRPLRPGCDCHSGWRPGVVLDPFMGSGTTATVAEAHGRDWIGIEINPDFARSARQRLTAASNPGQAAA